ncbi:hypothetical protein HK097_003863 [Rhizophlyctis rosea]|uniref:RRM domain-containing protein n=1 Tax=Rhizophlyctis rosea TaxID=64517 RepID=A0AAD5S4C1_9FUNG|nr:hypothetical protein HK097_003863 [Rhizophlyctis rosea]
MTDVTKEEQKPVVDTTAENVGAEKKDAAGGEGRRRRKTPAKEGVEAQEDDNTFKVFVGNLAFATTEDDLREYFNQSGKVINANIIVRGTRSLGYGFVSYETDEEAKKAVQALDKSELGGRQINVEQAKLKEAGEPRPRRGSASRGEGRPPRGGFGRRGRGRGYIRARGGRSEDKEGKETARLDDEQPAEGANGEQTGENRERRQRRAARGRRFPRPARATSGEPTSQETSKTTLFVANLPFKVTNEDLSSIFKEYKVTSAHVVKLRNGRSKGFGFVEVENEEQQQKVLNELKNVVVDGRELVIKVALASQVPPAASEGEEKAEEVKTESA